MAIRRRLYTTILINAIVLVFIFLLPIRTTYAALIKLDTPANLTITGTVLSWDKVEHADRYYISIGVGTENEYTSRSVNIDSGEVTSYDFQTIVSELMTSAGYTDSNDLILRVEVSAETNNPDVYSNSDTAKKNIPLSETGINIQKIKLDTPTNLMITGTVLSWDKVEHADRYYISIGVGTENEYTSRSVNIDSGEVTSYDFQTIVGELMTSAGYTDSNDLVLRVKVSAETNSPDVYSNSVSAEKNIPLSETGISIHKTKLDTPANLRLENTVFSWDSVENADYYYARLTLWKNNRGLQVTLGNGRLTEESIDIDSKIRSALSEAGYTSFSGVEVELEVQACSDNLDLYVNSDRATIVEYEYQGSHDWEADYTIDTVPTCTQEGSKSIHCKICNITKNKTSIPAKGHSFGDWKTIKKPTTTTKGVKERTCSVCGKKETAEVPMLPAETLSVKSLWASEHSVGKVKFKWTKLDGTTVTGWNLKYRTRKIGAGGSWSGWTTKLYPASTYEAWINIPVDYVIEIHAQAKGDKTWSTGIITTPAGGKYQAMKTTYVLNTVTKKRVGTSLTMKVGQTIKVRPDYEYPVKDYNKRPKLYPNQMLYDVLDKSIISITKPDGSKYTGGMIDGVATIKATKKGTTQIVFRAPNGRTQVTKITVK